MHKIRMAAAAIAAAGGIALFTAAAPAMACTAPTGGQCVGGNTNITANVSDSFTVVGFPTAVDFAAVQPGQTTAGAATPYAVTTNHGTGYGVTVSIDPADQAGNFLQFHGILPTAEDVLVGPGTAYIPLDDGAGHGFITVQHANAAGTALGAVQTMVSEAAVTIVSTTGPENGTVQYQDKFTLAIPGGSQASGAYTGTLDYVLAEN